MISNDKENEIIIRRVARDNKTYTEWQDITRTMDAIPDDEKYSAKGLEISAKIDTASRTTRGKFEEEKYRLKEAGEFYRDECNLLHRRIIDIFDLKGEQVEQEKYETSLISYSTLIRDLYSYEIFTTHYYKGDGVPLDDIIKRYEIFSKAYPDHIYTDICKELIPYIGKTDLGENYIDFSAPDLNGDIVKLSSQIKGKVAIIVIWSSWCGAMRSSIKDYIPLYNEFKDRGLTVVGVARVGKSENATRIAIEKDGYPWLRWVLKISFFVFNINSLSVEIVSLL